MKTLVTFCQKTGRRLRLYINRQVAKLIHKGQLKISVAVTLPLIEDRGQLSVRFQRQSWQRQQVEVSRPAPKKRSVPLWPLARTIGAAEPVARSAPYSERRGREAQSASHISPRPGQI